MDIVHLARNRQTLSVGRFLHFEIPNSSTGPHVRSFGLRSVSNGPHRCIEVEFHVSCLDGGVIGGERPQINSLVVTAR